MAQASNPASAPGAPKALPLVMLGALGVVFGDIGTSPLYALRQVFHDNPALASDPRAVTGVLSLIVWAVILAVCVKYTVFVLRADYDGEGGTLAMLGLIQHKAPPKPYAAPGPLVLLVLFGSALLYGDGMITPSISVLSAVEGLNVATSALKPAVLPIAAGILIGLFLLQRRGTQAVGTLFGPVMLLWFLSIGALGVGFGIASAGNPSVLQSGGGIWLYSRAWLERLCHARCRGVGVFRRGGPVRGSGAFRPASDRAGMVFHCAAGSDAELSGPGRAGAGQAAGRRRAVLWPGAASGAIPDGGALDIGDRNRQPGFDFRRVFIDPPGSEHGRGAALPG